MKKQIDLQLLATLFGGILFNYFFWMERLALNLLCYSVFILLMIFWNKETAKNNKMILTGAAHLLSALLVVYNNSELSIISWYTSLAVFIGFAYLPALRTVFAAIGAAILQTFMAPIHLFKRIANIEIGKFSPKPLLRPIKYILFPIAISILFAVLYSMANPIFGKYLATVLDSITNVFESMIRFLFADIDFVRVLHLLLGLFFTAALLLKYKNEDLLKAELSFVEHLIRKRILRKPKIKYEYGGPVKIQHRKNLILKTENIIGVLSFAALNILILALNTIDFFTLWISTPKAANFNYSAELHEGTNALIFSIVIAMVVILYFFNGNLNFYSKNKTIRVLSHIWIVQNIFLVAAVFLRDYNYIAMHGLTYKRIGVLVFLLHCTIGLATVYIKVAKQKTLFYLLKVNFLAWYTSLLLFSFFNWDVFIMAYNLNKSDSITIDIPHLFKLSDKTLPLVDSNRALIKKLIGADQATAEQLDHHVDNWIANFRERTAHKTWLSWNYRDAQTKAYFENKKQIFTLKATR
jgi:hypothetical protein